MPSVLICQISQKPLEVIKTFTKLKDLIIFGIKSAFRYLNPLMEYRWFKNGDLSAGGKNCSDPSTIHVFVK